ncbi:MAG TPA: hypothetical protein VFT70_16700 [Nocardioides sp.]|nr:hypothetical protein [Nocardioides sp.]
MSEFDQADEIQPEDRPDEEEFEGTDPGADSDETGTHYDELGEADATPHDAELVDGPEE